MVLSDRRSDSIFSDGICYQSTRVLQASIVLSLFSSLLYLSYHPSPLSPGFSPCFSFESKLLACHPSLLTASSIMRHYFLWPLYVSVVTFFSTCGCNNTSSAQQQFWRKLNFNLSMRMERNEDLGARKTCVGVCSLLSTFWVDHSQSHSTNM